MKPFAVGNTITSFFWPRDSAAQLEQGNRSSGPDFVCFGLQKAGTRWLFDQMNARRDVWMPPIKEINYFTQRCMKPDNVEIVRSGGGSRPVLTDKKDDLRARIFLKRFSSYRPESDVDWYRRLFDLKGGRASGDVSPGYSKLSPEMVAHVAKGLPETRFIFLIREPVGRLWSGVCMHARRELFTTEQITNWETLEPILRLPFATRNSYPSKVWERWKRIIPSDRIRFWFFDDIAARPETVVGEICDYLGLLPGVGALPANFNRKENNKKIPMPEEIRERLRAFLSEEIDRCADTFGGHARRWKEN